MAVHTTPRRGLGDEMSYGVKLIGLNLLTGGFSWGFNFDLVASLLIGVGASLVLVGYEIARQGDR